MNPNTYQYFEKKAAPAGSTLYYSVLFSPFEQRHAIVALYAFYQEISDIIDTFTDPQVAYTKLEWWKAEIFRLFDGQPRHPITQALQPILEKFPIPVEVLQSLIEKPNTEHITKLIALYIPGGNTQTLGTYAHELAHAMQLINNIINIRKFESALSEDLRTRLGQQAELAKTHYHKALEALPTELRRSQLAQITFSELQLTLLAEIQKDKFQTILTHKTTLTPLRKLWIAWKTKRKFFRRLG
jgi:15-cis-phytoene synthase